jgi:hypothetical protein
MPNWRHTNASKIMSTITRPLRIMIKHLTTTSRKPSPTNSPSPGPGWIQLKAQGFGKKAPRLPLSDFNELLQKLDPNGTSNALPSLAEMTRYLETESATTAAGEEVTLDQVRELAQLYLKSTFKSNSRTLYITDRGIRGWGRGLLKLGIRFSI